MSGTSIIAQIFVPLTLQIHVQNQSFIKTTDTSNIDSCNVGSDYAFP